MIPCAHPDERIQRIGEVMALLIGIPRGQETVAIRDTFVIERSFAAGPERVFSAFADADRKRRWFVQGQAHTVEAFEMDFQVGGVEHARYRARAGSALEGSVLASDGTYLDIKPANRIVTASTMTLDGQRLSACLVTLTFEPMATGSRLTCTHQGAFLDGADGPRRREDGWHQRLDQLVLELAH